MRAADARYAPIRARSRTRAARTRGLVGNGGAVVDAGGARRRRGRWRNANTERRPSASRVGLRGVAGATMALTHNMSDGTVWNAARREHLILLEKPAVRVAYAAPYLALNKSSYEILVWRVIAPRC